MWGIFFEDNIIFGRNSQALVFTDETTALRSAIKIAADRGIEVEVGEVGRIQ